MLYFFKIAIGSETKKCEVEELRLGLEKGLLILFIIFNKMLSKKELQFLENRGSVKLLEHLENSMLKSHWLPLRENEELFK